jgi:hypothetical protein
MLSRFVLRHSFDIRHSDFVINFLIHMHTNEPRPRLSRREVIKWFVAASAAMSVSEVELFAKTPAAAVAAHGYGSDPDLLKEYKPGDVWPLTLDAKQQAAAKALCDVLFPEDHLGPAASALGIAEFLDEWISAPYPIQQADRPVIIDGLAWLDAESKKRFKKDFAALDAKQQHAICDDICDRKKAKPEFKKAATFFSKFRSLTAGGYFSTEAGWKAIGYVGNVPLATFDGPPPEVLKQLGVEQTVV